LPESSDAATRGRGGARCVNQSAQSRPRLLPVVARSDRNTPQLRNRFDLFLIDGASLGQYLKVINNAVARSVQ